MKQKLGKSALEDFLRQLTLCLNIPYVIVYDVALGWLTPMGRHSFLVVLLFIIAIFVASFVWWTLDRSRSTTGENSELRLQIDGLVENPLNLTYMEIVVMPRSNVNAKLFCVGAPNHPVDEGNWTGVSLRFILEIANVSSEAVKVAFFAADGFATDLTVAAAMRGDILLAYEKDGESLPEKLRLIVPNKWGYKWISNLTRIELVNHDFKGFYESRGYSDEAEIIENHDK
ncbi:MAG: molybdopterin-dependent oxidoreductase [Candidatus Bathycorpusculaceae bacterium]